MAVHFLLLVSFCYFISSAFLSAEDHTNTSDHARSTAGLGGAAEKETSAEKIQQKKGKKQNPAVEASSRPLASFLGRGKMVGRRDETGHRNLVLSFCFLIYQKSIYSI